MKSEKTFEQAIHELETIVHTLEQGELALEDTLKQYEQGIQLSQFCQKILNEAQEKINNLKIKAQDDANNHE